MAETMMNRLLTLVLGSLMGTGVVSAAAQSSVGREQRHFSAEDETVENPVTIPQPVRELLAKEKMVKQATAFEQIVPEKFPASWFLASGVHLVRGNEEDLVLVGQGPMAGANITQFWVFRQTAQGYKLVLQAGAHDLTVTNRMHNGFREIELLSATAARSYWVLLGFLDGQYKVIRDMSQDTP
jgi:hypothetical protein